MRPGVCFRNRRPKTKRVKQVVHYRGSSPAAASTISVQAREFTSQNLLDTQGHRAQTSVLFPTRLAHEAPGYGGAARFASNLASSHRPISDMFTPVRSRASVSTKEKSNAISHPIEGIENWEEAQ